MFRFLRPEPKPQFGKVSYAQCGEDLIVDYIFTGLGRNAITYLDIGAHSPIYLSNTYFFYEKGCSGILVEPDPTLNEEIRRVRKRDTCLNMGVGGDSASEADFYVISASTLNTFSREVAEGYEAMGTHKIVKVVKVPSAPIETILAEHCRKCPDFVSIDVEGMEVPILRRFPFSSYRPAVFCIETLTYAEDNNEEKLTEAVDILKAAGYFVYADTYLNSILVDKAAWKARGKQ